MGSLYRLKGPTAGAPHVGTARTEKQGGGCKGQSTTDLVLSFDDASNASWLTNANGTANTGGQSDLVDLKNSVKNGPCEVSARPGENGGIEVRLQYADAKAVGLRTLVYQNGDTLVVDHWFGGDRSKSTGAKVDKHPPKMSKKKGSVSEDPLKMTGAFLDVFENQAGWDKLLESKVMAFDLNSPELDRFRWIKSKQSADDAHEFVERKELKLPYYDFAFFDTPLRFSPAAFPLKKFERSELVDAHEVNSVGAKKLEQGVNYVLMMAQEKDWLKAQAALSVLEKSDVAELLPKNNSAWWALKGLIYMRMGEKVDPKTSERDTRFTRIGLDIWREGLRNTAGSASSDKEYVEYMLLESLRELMTTHLEYAAAGLMTWADKFKWSPKSAERLWYLRGESLMKLGLYDESFKVFESFITKYKEKPVTFFQDRRIPSAIALRLGDIRFLQRDYKRAITQYTDAFQQIPTLNKFSFEGNWFPEEIRSFPYVFVNRAESYLRVGQEQEALRDLRGFLFVNPNHPAMGRVLYRIGDVLEHIGAPKEMVLNAWRECVFRTPLSLGGRLCESRRSAYELPNATPNNVPRILGRIETALPNPKVPYNEPVDEDDMRTFVSLVFADAFIKKNDTVQALFKIEPANKLESNPYLRAWYQEYFATVFAGYLQSRLDKGLYKEVVGEYEKRHKTFFLEETRPQVLYRVARAYENLGLFDEAEKTFEQAVKVKKGIGLAATRPYDVPEDEWKLTGARLALALMPESGDEDNSVRDHLMELDPSKLVSMRLWIEYGDKTHNAALENTWWAKLVDTTALTWDELRRYSKVLDEVKDSKTLRKVLEDTVGIWVADKNKARPKILPTDLMLVLAELRLDQDKELTKSLEIFNQLLALNDSEFHSSTPKPMVAYRKGLAMKRIGRLADARQSFELAQRLNPGSVWASLAANAQKEIRADQAAPGTR